MPIKQYKDFYKQRISSFKLNISTMIKDGMKLESQIMAVL